MSIEWLVGRRFEVPCTIVIENTPESLHAHVELDCIDARPGDMVRVHHAPAVVPFGERIVRRSSATVTRAGVLARALAHLNGYRELIELYEVGFSEGRPS
jgi:hypothetical protein